MVATDKKVRTRVGIVPFIPFLVISAIHLVGQLLDAEWVFVVTKPLLIPALVIVPLVTIAGSRERTSRLLVFGLALSWLGDLALMVQGEPWFIIGLLCFLVAHLAYIGLFISRFPHPASIWTSVYALWFVGLVWLLAPHLGALLVPVLIYGAVLGGMAVASSRAGLITALGGALFVVSDSLLAIDRFFPEPVIAAAGFWVMLTYLAAQGLIVWGVVRKSLG